MIPAEILVSFCIFSYIAAITPGPANITSLATSLQYGKRAALKQWVGILIGFAIDSISAAILVYFVGTALNEYVKWFSLIGAVYLVYLSFHMLRQDYSSDENEEQEVKEPGFWRGILVQLTNVKVMLTCMTSLSSYILPHSQNFWVMFLFGCLLVLTGPMANLIWLFAGLSLKKLFAQHQKLINIIMAVSLFACAVSLMIVPFTH